MEKSAIKQATQRYQRAKKACAALGSCSSYEEFETMWSDFLLAANAVFSKLEQGAKSSPKSRQWFGRQKRLRKDDPLMQYLHQARNSDEHGIEPVSRFQPGSTAVRGDGVYSISAVNRDGEYDIDVVHHSGDKPTIVMASPTAVLITVCDTRFGDQFAPPTEHLDTKIEDASPLGVARLAISYLETLISEAEAL